MTTRLTTVRAGALTTVQDAGRPGHAHLGVPRSGALDAPAMRLANRLLGNDPDTAVLETTLTGCALRPDRDVAAVVGGAPCAVTVDGRPAAWGAPVRVPAGSVLDVGTATGGVRSYVAVAGGIAAEPVLGSRSTDLLSGLGPTPLRDGDVLAVGAPARPAPPPVAAPGRDRRPSWSCRSAPARAPTGSRRPRCARSPRPPTASPRTATGSACAPRVRRSSGCRRANCPARAWSWAPCRYRRTAAR